VKATLAEAMNTFFRVVNFLTMCGYRSVVFSCRFKTFTYINKAV